ncbi:MAG: DUF4013 domain-containing protein [Caldilineales bacterium]|nr:DUF4013 domain-containing protein [Caldilineales bacterium]MCW5859083.1 DUF4013 domain-containing protein [Caldilineales bacterium]
MDIGKSISFVFEDKKWLEKILIGGLIVLATILFSWTIIGAIVGAGLLYGYMIELVRNVRRGDDLPMPEWDNWGEKIVLGIKYGILLIVWSLPILLITLPLILLSAIVGDSDAANVLGLAWTCFACLSILYGILILVATPAITIFFAERGDITDGLKFGDILRFTRQYIGDIIIAVIVILAVGIVAEIAGLLLCGIGLLFTSVWSTLVQGHLYGQIGRKEAGALVPSGGPAFVPPLPPSGGSRYDLTPDSIMPGVGEIASDVQSGAQQAVNAVQDLGESVSETVSETVSDK